MGGLGFFLGGFHLTQYSEWKHIGENKYRWQNETGEAWAEVVVERLSIDSNRLTWTFDHFGDSWSFCKEEVLYSPLQEEYIPSSIAR
jgi:hypothetical protein